MRFFQFLPKHFLQYFHRIQSLLTLLFEGVRTIDECYGQAMRAICPVGFMVRVTGAFYRQAITCPGSFHSNYCMREEPGNPACTGNQTCVFTSPWVHLSQECGYSNNFLLHYECIRSKFAYRLIPSIFVCHIFNNLICWK